MNMQFSQMLGYDNLADRTRWLLTVHGIDEARINWIINYQYTLEAHCNNDIITDRLIVESCRSRMLWYGLGEALLNYVTWEQTQH